jgi:histidinol-phosphate aminotransferase
MRFGYGLAPRELIEQMRNYSTGSTGALAKWGAAAALKDSANEATVKSLTIALREKITGELKDLGYDVIPSQANFFMVHVHRDVTPVIDEFRKRGVAVGRKFPPMVEHLRVSVGTESEMNRFMAAFKEIFASKGASPA